MKPYKISLNKLPGTDYSEVVATARREYHAIQKKTPRRQAYIRSQYFKKDKIFINQFWTHLNQKNSADRLRRLKFFSCAIEIIRKCPYTPDTTQNPSKRDELLHRYSSRTKNGDLFYVQIKENKISKRKDFMSVFPANNSKK